MIIVVTIVVLDFVYWLGCTLSRVSSVEDALVGTAKACNTMGLCWATTRVVSCASFSIPGILKRLAEDFLLFFPVLAGLDSDIPSHRKQ